MNHLGDMLNPCIQRMARYNCFQAHEAGCDNADEVVSDGPVGVALTGIRHLLTQFPAIADDGELTTADVCHRYVKPATGPDGWECVAQVVDLNKGWYSHTYRNRATGAVQDHPPVSSVGGGATTSSYADVLRRDPATAACVGPAHVFVSHAWQYRFADLVAALEGLVARADNAFTADGTYFWLDCVVIDEHDTAAKPEDYWSTSFRESIRAIGRTVMVLTPWDSPVPLTRSWCLWELFCTVDTGAAFSVALPPEQEGQLVAALRQDPGRLLSAVSTIDVARAQAGKESDRAMILDSVRRSDGGTARLNELAGRVMREWAVETLDRVLAGMREEGDWGGLSHSSRMTQQGTRRS